MLKMSFGNYIFAVFLFVSYVTGITDTVCDYAENSACDLTDMAHMRRFELPEWYSEGMQLFAASFSGAKWIKKDISWGIVKDSERLDRDTVEKVANEAFGKWSAVTSLKFTGPVDEPDIKIRFEHSERRGFVCNTKILTDGNILDDYGTLISCNDNINWTDPDGEDWYNIRISLLRQIGHSLGLTHSENAISAMTFDHTLMRQKTDYPLQEDDIIGIQALYGPPNGRKRIASELEAENVSGPETENASELETENAPAHDILGENIQKMSENVKHLRPSND